jgi:hypothetical protein
MAWPNISCLPQGCDDMSPSHRSLSRYQVEHVVRSQLVAQEETGESVSSIFINIAPFSRAIAHVVSASRSRNSRYLRSFKRCLPFSYTFSVSLQSPVSLTATACRFNLSRWDAARNGCHHCAKTNVPPLMFTFESANSLWGRTCDPWSAAHTAGGSSGGVGSASRRGQRYHPSISSRLTSTFTTRRPSVSSVRSHAQQLPSTC